MLVVSVQCTNTEVRSNSGYSKELFSSHFIENKIWDNGKAEISYYLLRRIDTLYVGTDFHITEHVDTFEISIVKNQYNLKDLKKSIGDNENSVQVFSMIQRRLKGPLYTGQSKSSSVQLIRENLRPIKASILEHSLEGNSFHEIRFRDGLVEQLSIGDGMKKFDGSYPITKNYYALEEIPLIVRSLNFEKDSIFVLPFITIQFDRSLIAKALTGDFRFQVEITNLGEKMLSKADSTVLVDKIQVKYPEDVFPPTKVLGHMIPSSEIYFISKYNRRQIVRIVSTPGVFRRHKVRVKSSYSMELLGSSFMDWWNYGENSYLKHHLN
ncbi:MAG: hypothetical protein Tsb0034_08190 [Ekhidna sp.]